MQDILNEIVKAIVVASIGLIGPIVVSLLLAQLKKIKIDVNAAQEDQIRSAVQNILVEVEEWASHRLKAQIPVTSGQKLSKAVEGIVEKMPKLDEAEAEALVRQELPKIGLGSVNFLNDQAAPPSKE